ncbi:MAG: type II toxin-antitoxin system VapC family toxin [Candidatus Lokiarchaeota archaeon]|nr:type II toxin-antitoxin system VapC family toxin [Candidatus Lokiarchaeota archaeon]
MIVLDTDVIIKLIDKKHTPFQSVLINKLEEIQDEDIVTTALNLEELLYGLCKRNKIIDFSHPIFRLEVLPFNAETAMRAAQLEHYLQKKGKKKTRGDILIASIVLEQNATLFTLHTKKFEDFEDLSLVKF